MAFKIIIPLKPTPATVLAILAVLSIVLLVLWNTMSFRGEGSGEKEITIKIRTTRDTKPVSEPPQQRVVTQTETEPASETTESTG